MRLGVSLLPLLCGCGYVVGNLYAVKSVDVAVFDNITDRRTQERDLTNVVVRELQAQGVRVNSPDADYELTGTITNFIQPTIIEGLNDQVVVGTVQLLLDIEIRNKRTGTIVVKESRLERATVMTERGENIDTARFEVFDRFARWIASKMESAW